MHHKTVSSSHACRYNAFLLLYPTGVVSEMVLLWKGLPYLRSRDLYSIHMPNTWNFAWDYAIFIQVIMHRAGMYVIRTAVV
jgi:hypothetical protein